MNRISIFSRGIIRENPVLVLILGICPVLAVSAQASSAAGMGIATTFVLVCSNIAISLLKNIIPNRVRIPCYIVLIAGFVALVQMLLEAYAFEMHQALGIFLPLIAVNCVIFARAEMFANKNKVFDSILDALGMGIGFTIAVLLLAVIREVLGSGSIFGIMLPAVSHFNLPILTMAPGGFIVFGCLIALINKISKGQAIKKQAGLCAKCPANVSCGKANTEEVQTS